MIDAVSPSHSSGRLAPLNRPLGSSASSSSASGSAPTRPADEVELSPDAVAFRGELVARVRSEIADGSYLTEAKLAATADRLLPVLTE
ncbi:MAG: hypothetical protein AAGI30_08750 [Planctomycetota bacterium]